MLVILGLLSVMPLVYMGKVDSQALIDFDFGWFGKQGTGSLSSVVTDEKVHVYKWRDQNGVMQFSNERPPLSVGAKQIVLNPNSNVIQAVKIAEKKKVAPVVKTESVSPYSVSGMKKVMDDAKGVEQVLQQRHEEQQQMMENL
ncbi:MAG: DUF4124 domain-containing protein [Gammaproteobacteria bacterium]|nr:DUF4124 domain-containing protein [Gammaproteobacteria bacterium]